ncbi:type II toxin-antitoxin system HicB family antitoxin [Runella zeae]|uniref:type II toxin-antitoxin system HicB family antitoxin n=1 Tax=Runella zeae TaxID=94255 RepID=UPI000402C039|nr:hypothetical protein [Runella zeae]
MTMKQTISLTAVLIRDPNDGGFTSYIAELPEVVAEGNTDEESVENLMSALKTMLMFKRDEASQEEHAGDIFSTKPLELEFV